ncbi:hypothetical protein BKH43_05565 [Helicobacter sp. 13S00401-1]|uniref:UvrD-helicase domain-containing protein n=1 Tax=Helicobacter sp. 13S00401-1 TaxID=1905758 RepID=UPI000BA78003|nr:UvrD-helicase domain-containing protein [Helicobacter sp. 13S00401-1]PAF50203.1 hypothetical protein BKH43_05565 [Helicobacter sp. 13S00401-1]
MEENHILLSASAGSGKTFALCLTYVALLLKQAEPSQIVAITFTKKASLEMSERVLKFLKTLKNYAQNKNTLSKDPLAISLLEGLKSEFDIDEAFVIKHIQKIYLNYLKSSTFIGTIDSLFNKILRRFSFFVGIKSDFDVGFADKRELLGLFLEQILKDNKELNLLLSLMKLNNKIDLNDILDLLETLHDKFYEFEHYPQDTQDIKEANKQQALIKALLKETLTSFKNFLTTLSISKKLDFDNRNIKSIFNSFENKSLLNSRLFYDLDYVFAKGAFSSFKLKDEEKQNIKDFQEKIQELLRQKEALDEKIRFSYLIKIIDIYERSLLRISLRTNSLSFDLVKQKVFELMLGKSKDSDTSFKQSLMEAKGFNSEFFYFRLDGSFSHMLIDEFQDTSMMQYKIFSPLFEEFRSGKGTSEMPKKLFFVGDNKQSIYRFRGANPEVYKHALTYTKEKLLKYNYRSSINIVDFVNDTFKKAFESTPITYTPQIPKSKEDGFVKVVIAQKVEKDDDPSYTACLSALNHINFLLDKGIDSKEIVVLVMKRKTGESLINVAKEEGFKLNFSIDGKEPLNETKHVKIIFYALKLKNLQESIKAAKDLSLKSIQTKTAKLYQKKLDKLLGKSYFEDISLPQDLDLNLSLPKQIKKVIDAFSLNSHEALQFLELSLESKNVLSIDELYEKAKSVKFILQQTSSLQIITVHASKGLEFKHVVFLDTNSSQKSDALIYNYKDLNLKQIVFKSANKEFIDESYAKAKEENDNLDFIDRLNRLYVAFTRARESLYISLVKPKVSQKDIATILNLAPFEIGFIKAPLEVNSQHKVAKETRRFHTFGLHPETQSKFLKKDEESNHTLLYSLGLKDSSLKGLALHKGLELSLGYTEVNPNLKDILLSEFGFFLDAKMLQDLSIKALSLIKDKSLDNAFKDKKISSEVSFLSNKRLRRIDALLHNKDDFVVLEFKSSFNPTLTSKYEAQLKDYLDFIDTYYNPNSLKGLLVYITSSDMKVQKVLLQKGDA